MTGKIKAIIKRPEEKYGHVTNISCTLENLQKHVDGPIETLTVAPGVVLVVNEEGKLREDLIPNFRIWSDIEVLGYSVHDVIYGTAIVLGVDGEEFADVPISYNEWGCLLHEWGNY